MLPERSSSASAESLSLATETAPTLVSSLIPCSAGTWALHGQVATFSMTLRGFARQCFLAVTWRCRSQKCRLGKVPHQPRKLRPAAASRLLVLACTSLQNYARSFYKEYSCFARNSGKPSRVNVRAQQAARVKRFAL